MTTEKQLLNAARLFRVCASRVLGESGNDCIYNIGHALSCFICDDEYRGSVAFQQAIMLLRAAIRRGNASYRAARNGGAR